MPLPPDLQPGTMGYAAFEEALKAAYTTWEQSFIMEILAKAEEIESTTGKRPTHLLIHTDVIKGTNKILDIGVTRNTYIEKDRGYLLTYATGGDATVLPFTMPVGVSAPKGSNNE